MALLAGCAATSHEPAPLPGHGPPAAKEAQPVVPVPVPVAFDAVAPPATVEPVAAEVPAPVVEAVPVSPHGYLYAPDGLVKIYNEPTKDAYVVGAFRAGQRIAIRDPQLRTESRLWRCEQGWYAVEPRGYVCVGGPGFATTDANDVRVKAGALVLPDDSAIYPFHFGTSIGAPRYLRIPTEAEQRQHEPGLDAHLASLPGPDPKTGAIQATAAGQSPPADLLAYYAATKPPVVDADGDYYEGFKVAWTRQFDAHGRTWLLTPGLTLVPKDKVRVQDMPTLHGVDLTRPDIKLPLAFTWLEDTVKYRYDESGKLQPTDEVIPRHSFVPASDDMQKVQGPGTLFRKLGDGSYVKWQDITVINNTVRRPGGVGPNEKWIEVRVTWGFLMAFEGDRPVFATAMSPGVAGVSASQYSTKMGKHFATMKLITSDMSGRDSGKEWYVDEVPWAQYYWGNYALHGAWWHNNFGRPMSHGCVNLPAADAKFLFEWTEPQLPKGWYGVVRDYLTKGTLFYIRH